MYNTFNGWKLRGRVVIAGERGAYRNEYGDYMYHISQTTVRGFRRPLGFFYPAY